MGLKILNQKCACGSSFITIIWKSFSLKMGNTELGHQAVFSAEIIGEQRDAEAEKNLL